MENEVKEVMDEGLCNEIENVDRKSAKVKVLGITVIASVSALLFKFRKKITTRIERSMANKLIKKGYSVTEPTEVNDISEKIIDNLS